MCVAPGLDSGWGIDSSGDIYDDVWEGKKMGKKGREKKMIFETLLRRKKRRKKTLRFMIYFHTRIVDVL